MTQKLILLLSRYVVEIVNLNQMTIKHIYLKLNDNQIIEIKHKFLNAFKFKNLNYAICFFFTLTLCRLQRI